MTERLFIASLDSREPGANARFEGSMHGLSSQIQKSDQLHSDMKPNVRIRGRVHYHRVINMHQDCTCQAKYEVDRIVLRTMINRRLTDHVSG